MRNYGLVTLLWVVAASAIAGCCNNERVQRVPPPGPGQDTPYRDYERNKPLPGEAEQGQIERR